MDINVQINEIETYIRETDRLIDLDYYDAASVRLKSIDVKLKLLAIAIECEENEGRSQKYDSTIGSYGTIRGSRP